MVSAQTLLVFGRGVTLVDGRWALSAESLARVRCAVDHVRRGPGLPRVVFTGGWALAHRHPPPPDGFREGDLMRRAALDAGLDADVYVETRSRTTLQNVLHTVEDGLLGAAPFTAARPLGIVSHAWHLPRVRYLIDKALRLRGDALLDIPVDGGGPPRPWWAEGLITVGARVCFAGASGPVALRRRERLIAVASRRGR